MLPNVLNLDSVKRGWEAVRQVPLRSGDEAVMLVTGVEAGAPDSVPVAERDQRQRLLADQRAQMEITGYAENVRAAATVRVPDEVIDPDF